VYTTPPPVYTGPAPYVPPPQSDPLAPAPTATGPAPEQPTGAREPIFDWFKRKPIAWIGAGVTVIGLGMGIGFSAAAAGASGNANNYADQITAQAKKDGVSGPPCGVEDDPNDDVKTPRNYHGPCEVLRASLSDYRTDVGVATTGWILFGLGAIGTTVYALVDWYPKKTASTQGPRILGVAPVVSPKEGGVGVVGVF
jgi:hypothetical protein